VCVVLPITVVFNIFLLNERLDALVGASCVPVGLTLIRKGREVTDRSASLLGKQVIIVMLAGGCTIVRSVDSGSGLPWDGLVGHHRAW
jgi:hypothetical protein